MLEVLHSLLSFIEHSSDCGNILKTKASSVLSTKCSQQSGGNDCHCTDAVRAVKMNIIMTLSRLQVNMEQVYSQQTAN